MTVVIVDTTVWVDYLNGVDTEGARWLDGEIDHQRLGLTDLILCEVLHGLRDEREAESVLQELLKFEVFSTGGVELAWAAAQNYRMLRSRGRTVRKTIDCLIATFCLVHDHTLVHNDRDFDTFEELLGLKVLHH
jgi:predicted nucleic acid-binding protein